MPDGGAPSQAMSQPDFSPYLEDEFTAEDVAQALGDVESLLDKLDPLIGA